MSLQLKADVLLVFDTTGSMYPCAYETKRSISQIATKLFDEAEDVRVGVIAHGDYCDAGITYVTMTQDFTESKSKLTSFVHSIKPTHGGDFPECYELVLNQAKKLSWRDDAKKLIVMIGDAVPHPEHDPQNTLGLNWKQEALDLSNRGIKIYAVHAMPGIRKSSTPFWESLADITGGTYLTSDQFSIIPDLIVAATYSQIEFSNKKDKYNFLLANINSSSYCTSRDIERLSGYAEDKIIKYSNKDNLHPVPDGKFQVMSVLRDIPIKEFVEDAHLIFEKGKGYYELGRTETVQCYKSIILQEKSSGKLFEGPQVRGMLGLQPESPKGTYPAEKLKPVHLDKYRVFIQSTSYNRKLKEGALFLYEVGELDRAVEEFKVGKIPKSSKSKLTSKGMVDRAVPTKNSGDVVKPHISSFDLSSAEPLSTVSPVLSIKDKVEGVSLIIKGKEVNITSGMAVLMDDNKVYLLLVVGDKVFYVNTLKEVKLFNHDNCLLIYKPLLRTNEAESYLEYDANNFSDEEKTSQTVFLA